MHGSDAQAHWKHSNRFRPAGSQAAAAVGMARRAKRIGAEPHSGTRLASTFVAADGAKPSPRPTSTRVAHSAKMPAEKEWRHTPGNVGWTRACSEPDASECDHAIAKATVPLRTHLCGGRRQQRAQAPDGHARHQHLGAAHPTAKDHRLTLGAFFTANPARHSEASFGGLSGDMHLLGGNPSGWDLCQRVAIEERLHAHAT